MQGLLITVAVIAVVFFSTIAGALFGGLCGWVIQLTPLADFILAGLKIFGVEVSSTQLPGLGAFFGFIGGFIRSSLSTSK